MTEAPHTTDVPELAWLTLPALKGVLHLASATGVDHGTYTPLRNT